MLPVQVEEWRADYDFRVGMIGLVLAQVPPGADQRELDDDSGGFFFSLQLIS